MIADKYFPGGAVVGVNTWVAHYNKDVFGADADVFRPERWLVGDTTAMNRYYFPVSLLSRFVDRRILTTCQSSGLAQEPALV